MAYIYLVIAIVAEVVATSALKASEEFTKLIPSLIVIIGYGVAFYFLTLVLRTIPVGLTYADNEIGSIEFHGGLDGLTGIGTCMGDRWKFRGHIEMEEGFCDGVAAP